VSGSISLNEIIFYDRVFASAKAHGGVCVKQFSQGLPPVSGLIGRNADTKNGVCMALVNKWVAEHANGGSLWTWLLDRGGRPDSGKIVNVMINFLDTLKGGGGATTQWRNSEKYLKQYNVVRRLDVVSAGPKDWTYDFGKPGPAVGDACARWLIGHDAKSNAGYYRSFCFMGSGGGHITTMWLAQDVCFFDPNFGEYWFEKRSDFAKWFRVFWQISGYQSTYSSIQFCDWGLSATARR
jgi:YopT peptidase